MPQITLLSLYMKDTNLVSHRLNYGYILHCILNWSLGAGAGWNGDGGADLAGWAGTWAAVSGPGGPAVDRAPGIMDRGRGGHGAPCGHDDR